MMPLNLADVSANHPDQPSFEDQSFKDRPLQKEHNNCPGCNGEGALPHEGIGEIPAGEKYNPRPTILLRGWKTTSKVRIRQMGTVSSTAVELQGKGF